MPKYLTQTFMSHCNEMICQQVMLSGYAEWPKVADAVIKAHTFNYSTPRSFGNLPCKSRLIQDERAAAWACPNMRDRCLPVLIKHQAAHACARGVLRRSALLVCAQETWPRSCTELRQGEVHPRFTPGSRSYRYTERGRGGPVLATPFSGRFPMSTKAAEHHEHAAEQHEHAARHHKEAAKHHKAGSHEKAAHHAHTARGHHEQATHHASEAAKAHTEEHGHK